ncbi:hypothetical protein [Bradyrhizobium sp. LMG 9283]|uniref:hypothetical protein n=1 Tax=Bradyrhizobium sp. LMG 9283 TaxID=592064 RepID=UPI00388D21FF
MDSRLAALRRPGLGLLVGISLRQQGHRADHAGELHAARGSGQARQQIGRVLKLPARDYVGTEPDAD